MRSYLNLLLSLSVCAIFAHSTVEARTIIIGAGEWPPYVSKDLPDYGFVAHAVTQSLLLQNIKVEFKFYPWKRTFELAKKNQLHLTLPWLKSKDREKFFLYSNLPIAFTRSGFFHNKDMIVNWTRIEDLNTYRIGATIGYHYNEQFTLAEQQGLIRVKRKPSDKLNFKRLIDYRIDLFVSDIEVGYSLLNKHFSAAERQQIVHHPKLLFTSPLYLIASKSSARSQELLQLFEKGFAQYRKTEDYMKWSNKHPSLDIERFLPQSLSDR